MEKDIEILNLLDYLRAKYGAEQVRPVDHWEADLVAIGLTDASGDNLVYVSTWNQPAGYFFVELEVPSTRPHLPYDVAGRFERVDLSKLEDILISLLNWRESAS